MNEIFGVASFVIGFGMVFPYAKDIIGGRAKPARSTRILLFILLWATLFVQTREFTTWALSFTVAQVLGQTILVVLGLKYGLGGVTALDKGSYGLFGLTVATYLVTSNELLGLIMLCTADFVAFVPTIVKNWKDPSTDTPLFYSLGIVAAFFSLVASTSLTDIYQVLFPAYIMLAVVLALIPLIWPSNRVTQRLSVGTSNTGTE